MGNKGLYVGLALTGLGAAGGWAGLSASTNYENRMKATLPAARELAELKYVFKEMRHETSNGEEIMEKSDRYVGFLAVCDSLAARREELETAVTNEQIKTYNKNDRKMKISGTAGICSALAGLLSAYGTIAALNRRRKKSENR